MQLGRGKLRVKDGCATGSSQGELCVMGGHAYGPGESSVSRVDLELGKSWSPPGCVSRVELQLAEKNGRPSSSCMLRMDLQLGQTISWVQVAYR